jgi:hypothetical protein
MFGSRLLAPIILMVHPDASCTVSAGFHITVFELSYRGRGCWSGSEHFCFWATGERAGKSSRILTMIFFLNPDP